MKYIPVYVYETGKYIEGKCKINDTIHAIVFKV